MDKRKLKADGRLLKPVINIGKNGLTEELILHINKTLKKKKLIKIKFNSGSLDKKDKKELQESLLDKIDAELVDFVGFNAILYKR